jgi:hypothetical protein
LDSQVPVGVLPNKIIEIDDEISFVELLFLFGVLGGWMCDVNSCNVFLLLFMALWAPISANALQECSGMPSCSSGLGFFLVSSLCVMACAAFSCKKRESRLMKFEYMGTGTTVP